MLGISTRDTFCLMVELKKGIYVRQGHVYYGALHTIRHFIWRHSERISDIFSFHVDYFKYSEQIFDMFSFYVDYFSRSERGFLTYSHFILIISEVQIGWCERVYGWFRIEESCKSLSKLHRTPNSLYFKYILYTSNLYRNMNDLVDICKKTIQLYL